MEIWSLGETFDFDAPTIKVIAPGGWWGGAIILSDENEKYDVSKIVSVSFDIVSDKNGSVYVDLFQKGDGYKEYIDLRAGVQISKRIGPFSAITDKVGRLVAFGEDNDVLKGALVKITGFTFYDANGNEVVPQLVGAN